jgi:hypothetical protein
MENFNLKMSLITGLFFFMTISCMAQNESSTGKCKTIYSIYTQPNKKGTSEEERAWDKSKGSDAYQFMSLRKTIGALNTMISATGEEYWINQQVKIIDNLIQTAKTSSGIPDNRKFRDDFKGWISLTKNRLYHNEVPLYESYSFFYIMQFLFLVKNTDWIEKKDSNKLWWNNTLAFVEKNIWTKWYERSYLAFKDHYRYFLRSRIHMGSHWAGLAMYLSALTSDKQIQSQTALLVQQYDTLLKRNLKISRDGYIWNSTYDNMEGTFAVSSPKNIIQDVSHGNHVVSYIIAAYEFGNKNWTLADIHKLSYTLKKFMYDRQNNMFHDNVDGSSDENRPGWGNFVADGWVKLAAYDEAVKAIFQRFEKSKMLKKYNQEFQFKANLYKNDMGNE